MPVTISPRSTWAAYVKSEKNSGHASRPPQPENSYDWNAGAGVFIHYRGNKWPVIDGPYKNEEDCRKDIAVVYENHWGSSEYEGDIAYNFIVCQHGNIYQGRGYQRGSANGGSAPNIDGYGRNAGFYSILGLLRGDETATEPMVQSMRALIAHLRDEAPKRTGNRIIPHQYQYETDCPGYLLPYAQPGSSIDPSVPWQGLADVHLAAAQRRCNEQYKDVPGYIPCPTFGRPSWSTVLSFTQGLQHELGISPVVQIFGPGTFNAVKQRNTMPEYETNANIKRLLNGALWAKGYWTSTNQALWTPDSQAALERLYADAGLTYSNIQQRYAMWPHVVKALMRMDQFRLVPGGDINIQRVQQKLNQRYVAGIRIPAMSLVPCDGIYSRDVQQGFMMGVQYELGLAVASINGYFGPGTQSALRGKGSQPLTGELRYLFRAACYFNSPVMVKNSSGGQSPLMYNPADFNTNTNTSTHSAWLRAFQQFSQIPVTVTNDYTTWAQLLVSSGDTARPAAGCDCITEITAARGQALYAAGYRIVGRYLDEHLPPTDPDFLNKALKPNEPRAILNAGLRFFPIFQYNGTQLMNFTYEKGVDQGQKAHDKAVQLRIPPNTCIYFAVDYDALDVEIDSHVKPYFEGVKAGLAGRGRRYTFGVYGSRNVCSRVSHEVGARWSLVSGMSWGFSGNLGFPLPENWSFNQIREYNFQPGWGLDHDVWRNGADPGVSTLV